MRMQVYQTVWDEMGVHCPLTYHGCIGTTLKFCHFKDCVNPIMSWLYKTLCDSGDFTL